MYFSAELQVIRNSRVTAKLVLSLFPFQPLLINPVDFESTLIKTIKYI